MTAQFDRDAWLEDRRTGIGGSDVGPILGVSPYRTPLDVFRDKRGELADSPETAPMRWGNLLEPVVRQEYSSETGREVLMPTGILRHQRHDFMLANLDGFTSDGRIYEGKTARIAQGWGEPGTDEVPQVYLFQVQHYMAVTGYPVADIAVLIGGSDFRIYTVEADAELHDMLMDVEAEFWRRVQENDPPDPISYADAIARWGNYSRPGASVVASREVMEAIDVLRELNGHAKSIEERIEEQKATILKELGEAEALVDPGGALLCTWKLAKAPQRFDAKALAAEHPEIHAQFLKTGEPSRRFLLK
jgi:putative phage-type endonuclease